MLAGHEVASIEKCVYAVRVIVDNGILQVLYNDDFEVRLFK